MNEKTRHTTPVTNPATWCDNVTENARKLPSWHDPVLKPPFEVTGGVVVPGGLERRFNRNRQSEQVHARPKAAVGVTLGGYGVTWHKDGVTGKEGPVTQWFTLVDALNLAMEWIETDLPGTDILFLFTGRYEGRAAMPTDLSLPTMQVMATAHRWSVMPFARQGHYNKCDGIGVFRNRDTRDAWPAWRWHYLGGSLLVDRSEEHRA
jgi:hypothetical protein